ncbi:MAG: alternative ribosome rescue aminoacyl-tRNA hydrolase ArfB [Myxococcota bacterium]
MEPLRIRDDVVIPASELTWTAVRASGPGGQNVNKVATKVELRFHLSADQILSELVKARLRCRHGDRIDASGDLLVTSQATRSQSKNLQDAREKLAAWIRGALRRPKRRVPTKRTRGSERRRLNEKRMQSEKKRLRSGKFD